MSGQVLGVEASKLKKQIPPVIQPVIQIQPVISRVIQRVLVVLVVAPIVVLGPALGLGRRGTARAQSDNGAAAEALFREGKRLLEAHQYADACPKLAESFRLDPATGALLALAICDEDAGKLASAWTAYAEVAKRSKRERRPDRERAARDKVAALEPRLSKLTISVVADAADTPGLDVKRDDDELPRAAWGVAVPVDAGTHTVVATAPGRATWRMTVTAGPNADRKTIDVPQLLPTQPPGAVTEHAMALPSAESASSEPVAFVQARPAASTSRGGMTGMQTGGLVVAGAGVLTLAGAGWFVIEALQKKHSYEMNPACARTCADLVDANHDGNIATGLSIAGGVLAAAGATMYFVGGGRSDAARTQADAAPARHTASLAVGPAFVASRLGIGASGAF